MVFLDALGFGISREMLYGSELVLVLVLVVF
jgi:hypothetical protein